jgi:hypothetical protein
MPAQALRAEIWRNDLNPSGIPTVESVLIHAEDSIDEQGDYRLIVSHIDSFPNGKGFMARVSSKFPGSGGETGHVHRGTGQDAYEAAKREGERMLKRWLEKRH